jgi:hypothetical protein
MRLGSAGHLLAQDLPRLAALRLRQLVEQELLLRRAQDGAVRVLQRHMEKGRVIRQPPAAPLTAMAAKSSAHGSAGLHPKYHRGYAGAEQGEHAGAEQKEQTVCCSFTVCCAAGWLPAGLLTRRSVKFCRSRPARTTHRLLRRTSSANGILPTAAHPMFPESTTIDDVM